MLNPQFNLKLMKLIFTTLFQINFNFFKISYQQNKYQDIVNYEDEEENLKMEIMLIFLLINITKYI